MRAEREVVGRFDSTREYSSPFFPVIEHSLRAVWREEWKSWGQSLHLPLIVSCQRSLRAVLPEEGKLWGQPLDLPLIVPCQDRRVL